MSPYATGGGGVTFERKVAVLYLARLLVGDGATELGDGRCVVSVAFQQAPEHAVDDLVVNAARPDEPDPSLVLSVAVRRSPELVSSDEATQKLVRAFVDAVLKVPADGQEHRWCLVVAGSQPHAKQLAELATLAATQLDARGFFDLIRTTGKFDAGVRGRLDQIEKLVQRALHDLGRADIDTADAVQVQQHAWRMLAGLSVSMPRIETPDETDWAEVANRLIPAARGSDLPAASRLRDRLVTLAGEYSPTSARVDLTVLRRDAHDALDPTARCHRQGWQALDHLHRSSLASVRDEIKDADGDRRLRLDRSAAVAALAQTVAGAAAVVVGGESGVGKSALALGLPGTDAADADRVQALCINLRHVHKLTVEFEQTLGCPLSTLLYELSAPQRMLIIDGADAVAEGRAEALRYVVDAAHASDVKVVAVVSDDNKQVVRDTLADRFGANVKEYTVAPLTDAEIAEIVTTFGELAQLGADPRPRELLRRLVVVDLLVRSGVSGVPLSDADAMREIWSGLVRRRGMSDRGSPDARESVLLRLAALALDDVGDMERLDAVQALDSGALIGLRQDGLLAVSADDAFRIGPEFGHDEVRRYAVARLLLAGRDPASRIMKAGAPRWSLAAARLACQALLAEPDGSTNPLRGRLAALQASFDAIVAGRHGSRWSDVPGEAMLKLANPSAVLRDAWSLLRADDATGLRRLVRLVEQRLTTDGIVDIVAVEPIITLLLEDHAPWRWGGYAHGLLRDWLRAHVVAETVAGHRLRTLLRTRLVDLCTAADRRLAKKKTAVARSTGTAAAPAHRHRFLEGHPRFVSETGRDNRRTPPQPELPREITDKTVTELLALLGPDVGEAGETILRRIARDAPEALWPAVEEPLTGPALARYRAALLAHLTEAYYLDDEAEGHGLVRYGVRDHRTRSYGITPLAAWYRGPFIPLFQIDFINGVALLNRILNHAARLRIRTLARLDRTGLLVPDDRVGPYQVELKVTGIPKLYIGDDHVWRWYRGTGVGPFPCLSALQALERVCDQLIEIDIPIRRLIAILLDGCQNLAMVGLVVGLLVRHLENADALLDPYFTEPFVWHQEFGRIVNEGGILAADSEGLVAAERRTWSLRDAATVMVLRAKNERVAELRELGKVLIANARSDMESMREHERTQPTVADAVDSTDHWLATVGGWASYLDRGTYRAQVREDGVYIQPTPPDHVTQALQSGKEELERGQEATRLIVRYLIEPEKTGNRIIDSSELVADIAVARKLLGDPRSSSVYDPWDAAAAVAAAALDAHFRDGTELPMDALSSGADILLRIGDGEAGPRLSDLEDAFFGLGADRTAARVLPTLLLPNAARLREVVGAGSERAAFGRAARGGVRLARAVANEVRLHLARGLDHIWDTPCVEGGLCQHEVGLQIATETMRDCVLVPESAAVRPEVVTLEEPFDTALADLKGASIIASRLDAAIRALAPAAMGNGCVSTRARRLLVALLDAQRRSLLSGEGDEMDDRGSHTLVGARALLTLAELGDDGAIFDHINAYMDNSALLGTLLRAFAAAAEETPTRAATARCIWPRVMSHVLKRNVTSDSAFPDDYCRDRALASLIPNASPEGWYLYDEVEEKAITWWEPLAWRSEVEAWLAVAAGRARCVDQLVSFVGVLPMEQEVRTALPWVARLVLADPGRVARGTFLLADWLIERRAAASDGGLLSTWQEIVDALVVEGVTRLAAYSE